MNADVPLNTEKTGGVVSASQAGKEEQSGVSVIIVFSSGSLELERLLETFLRNNTHVPVELICVIHGGENDISETVSRYKDDFRFLFIRLEERCSRASACNLGVNNAVYPYLLFLDQEIIYNSDVLPGALAKMEEFPGIGAVGVRFDKNFESSIGQYNSDNPESSTGRYTDVLNGGFLLCRKKDFQALGGFSEDYENWLEDKDFCLRLARDLKKKNWCLNQTSLQRNERDTSNPETHQSRAGGFERDRRIFEKRWNQNIRTLSRPEDLANSPLADSVAHKWIKACPDLSGKEVCIFAAYEPEGILAEFKTIYLAALKRAGFVIVLVVALDDLNVKLVTRGLDFVDAILARENIGFDFASWSAVMTFVPSVWKSRLLILANDSVFGPSRSFDRVVEDIRASKSDVIGLTASKEIELHLQSYFFALKNKALKSSDLRKYWAGVRAFRDKRDVILEYEIKMRSFCLSIGLECSALYSREPYFQDSSGKSRNPMHYQWKDLIERGFPFIKVDLIRYNPAKENLDDLDSFLLRNGFSERLVRYGIPEVINRMQGKNTYQLDVYHSSRNVKKTENGVYQWASQSDAPAFYLDINHLPAGKPGWYIFSLILNTSIPKGNAAFHFYTGEGVLDDQILVLPYENNKAVTRIIYIDQPFTDLRFFPADKKCRFTVKRIQVYSFDEAQAENSILGALVVSEKYRKISGRADLRKLLGQLAEEENLAYEEILRREYDSMFTGDNILSYHDWINEAERSDNPDLQFLYSSGPAFLKKPLISVIMTVREAPEHILSQAVESVLKQSYPFWELCIACEGLVPAHIRKMLSELEAGDSRFKAVYRPENGSDSVSGNTALSLASGDYLVFLEPSDKLAESALHHLAEAVNKSPLAEVIYSDEDRIDQNGKRCDPFFKPDWNPYLFFSQNYISHSILIRRSLIEKTSGFRAGFEDCRYYDLLLRCLPFITDEQIVHVSRVLYHRGFLESNVSNVYSEVSRAAPSGIKALRDYFNCSGRYQVSVQPGLAPGAYRVRYPVPNPTPLVSLIIPTRDKPELIKSCVLSILEKTTYENYEILIVDNQSRERQTLRWFRKIQKEDSRVKVIRYDHQFNFSAICNFGVQHAPGGIIGLINNDIEVISPDWLGEMVSHASRPEIGCVGAKLYFPDNTLQHAGVVSGHNDAGVPDHIYYGASRDDPGYFDRLLLIQNYSAVTAAVLLVRKSVYLEVGGFDEVNLTVAMNDVDFCFKVQNAGYRNLWTPYAELYHHESKSRGYETTAFQKQRCAGEVKFMKKKWSSNLNSDPALNVNLRVKNGEIFFNVPGSADC
jgi:GT2 family glycosyltransferase